MKHILRIAGPFIFLHLFLGSAISAQDLTGIWRGHFRSNESLERLPSGYEERFRNYDDRYKMEVQIAQTDNQFEAVTYSYKSTEFYGKAEASGTLNAQSKKVLLKEAKLLEVRFASGGVCMMTCFMQYSKLGSDEYLQGTYYSTSVSDSLSGCGKGSIFLHRVIESDFHKEPFLEKRESEILSKKKGLPIPKAADPVAKDRLKNTAIPPKETIVHAKTPAPVTKLSPPVVKPPAPVISTAPLAKQPVFRTPAKKQAAPVSAQRKSMITMPEPVQSSRDSSLTITQPSIAIPVPQILKTRTNVLLKTLTITTGVVELRLYDDGAIDNDTVSVYYDNKILISKARLSDQPITVMLPISPSDHPHELVMVAENLGDIPPNTSLLVVRDGEKRYEERIVSTEQKNVQINFVYKKVQ